MIFSSSVAEMFVITSEIYDRIMGVLSGLLAIKTKEGMAFEAINAGLPSSVV